MAHQTQPIALDTITELLAEHGFDGLAQAVTALLSEVMKIERSAALGAGPYQRTEGPTAYANGHKPTTIHTLLGPMNVEMPQARGVELYPSVPEEGIRSERALKRVVAEMHVQGDAISKVAAITEKLCGTEVTRSHVSPAARAVDSGLKKWRPARSARRGT